jgi:hypothetical protein
MGNGIASIPGTLPATVVLLTVLLVALGGCNANTAPPLPTSSRLVPDDQPRGVRYLMDPARDRAWILTSEGVSFHIAGTPGTN